MVKKIYQLKEVFVQEKKKIQFLSETIFVLKCAVTVCMIKKMLLIANKQFYDKIIK
jgi:hypothetical protein